MMELLTGGSAFLSTDICDVGPRCWTVPTPVFSSIGYTSCCSSVPPPACASGGLFNTRSTRSCPNHPTMCHPLAVCSHHCADHSATSGFRHSLCHPWSNWSHFLRSSWSVWSLLEVSTACWEHFWHQHSVTTWTISKCSSSFWIHRLKKKNPC